MIKARRTISVLLALIISFSVISATAQAFDGDELRFTYNAADTFTLGIDGNQLLVSFIPNKSAYRYGLIRITDTAGYAWIERDFERPADGQASLSLSSLGVGTYYVELYFNNDINGYYRSYTFGDEVILKWYGDFGEFKEPRTYSGNWNKFIDARTDNAALAFYLKATPYIECDDKIIADKAAEITAGLVSDYDKALALHDWICVNIWYDKDLVKRGGRTEKSAIETLDSRRAVCSGFSNLYAAFLRSLDIPTKLIYGYGLTTLTGGWNDDRFYREYNHVWNEVFIGGRWIIVDTTWDCGNEYEFGRVTLSEGLRNHRYFDATVDAFSINHRIVTDDSHHSITPAVSDVPANWASVQVRKAEAQGLVPRALRTGYTSQITREDFCRLVVRLYEKYTGYEIKGRTEFSDVANVFVEKAAYIGVVNGVGDGRFEPQKKLTREEAAVMLARLSDVLGYSLSENGADFSDFGTVSNWARDAVGQVQAAGVMSGDTATTFSPKSPYTREQSFITILRLYEML